jgi:hypothetical protein
MNTLRTLLALSASLLALPTIATAQLGGDPTMPPAGAPGPVMKTLDQVEPRTPLVDGAPGVSVAPSGTITISQSGSYYLTENLSVTSGDGINVDANGVTLDLRGFTITSSAATAGGEAIDLDGSGSIGILAGSVSHCRSETISGTAISAFVVSNSALTDRANTPLRLQST